MTTTRITMLDGLHLTATNKRHIGQMIAQGLTTAGTKALRYRITDRADDIVKLVVSTRDSDAFGRKFWRRGEYTVQIAGEVPA